MGVITRGRHNGAPTRCLTIHNSFTNINQYVHNGEQNDRIASMILTYHGGACVKATAGDTTIVFAPVSRSSKNFKPTNFGADVALLPLSHPDMNGAEEAARGDREPFVIFGPGEFEVKDIASHGFQTETQYDGKNLNTVYSLKFDGLNVLYLGALSSTELPAEVMEMDEPDILITPIGGAGVLSPADAQKLAVKLEAKIVIPILFDDKSLKQFLKEASAEGTKPEEKITLKPRDVADKQNEVVVLSS